jgi:hypothetical protein
MNKRIFEKRYFQSRLLILDKFKKQGFNHRDVKISISHSKSSFACLIMPKEINASIDFEPSKRLLPEKFKKKINILQKGVKLIPLKYLLLLETFIKLKVLSWSEIKMPINVKNICLLSNIYESKINKNFFYSRFFNIENLTICVSSDNLENIK